MKGDGDGWAPGPNGTRVWGKYGAAGLMLMGIPADGASTGSGTSMDVRVLMQHRAAWTNQGNTWGLPGGARDSHETASQAALREAIEETSLDPALVTIRSELVTAGPFCAAEPDGTGWTYTTVLATTTTGAPIATFPNHESVELRWVSLDALEDLPLLPAFAASLPELREAVRALGDAL